MTTRVEPTQFIGADLGVEHNVDEVGARDDNAACTTDADPRRLGPRLRSRLSRKKTYRPVPARLVVGRRTRTRCQRGPWKTPRRRSGWVHLPLLGRMSDATTYKGRHLCMCSHPSKAESNSSSQRHVRNTNRNTHTTMSITSAKKLRIAVLGLGRMGKRHARHVGAGCSWRLYSANLECRSRTTSLARSSSWCVTPLRRLRGGPRRTSRRLPSESTRGLTVSATCPVCSSHLVTPSPLLLARLAGTHLTHGRWYADSTEAINSPDVDAVLIATDTATHATLAIQALEAGKVRACGRGG